MFYLKYTCLSWVVSWLQSSHHCKGSSLALSQPVHKCLVFFASHRPYHCGRCSIDLFDMNIVLIKWPHKIYNFKWLVMDYPECKWPKHEIKPN